MPSPVPGGEPVFVNASTNGQSWLEDSPREEDVKLKKVVKAVEVYIDGSAMHVHRPESHDTKPSLEFLGIYFCRTTSIEDLNLNPSLSVLLLFASLPRRLQTKS